MNRTDLSKIGEFGIIDRINSKFKNKRNSSIIGIGDDAAVTNTEKENVVISSDMLIEGIHFDLSYTPLKHLGYKSVIINISDIYSMNSYPKQILLNIALSSKFSLEALDEFYDGVKYACDDYKVDLIGGDTTSSTSGLIISGTALGYNSKKNIVTRENARPDDIICVSGDLGRAYAGLLVLQKEKENFIKNPKIQPSLDNYKSLVEKQLRPKARKDIIDFFYNNNIRPNAMIDISDGLSSELIHLSKSSKLGFKIYEEKLPISLEVTSMMNKFKLSPLSAALKGGEEYELLFSLPLDVFEKMNISNIDITAIGHFTKKNKNLFILKNNQEVEIESQGWNHFIQ
mgnify:FL=1|jgi:thiamine-monophosphate kinase